MYSNDVTQPDENETAGNENVVLDKNVVFGRQNNVRHTKECSLYTK